MTNIKNKVLSVKTGSKPDLKTKQFIKAHSIENHLSNGISKFCFPVIPVSPVYSDERKNAAEAIGRSADKLSLVMNAALDAIICIDTTGNISFWNVQAEAIFGWCESEVMGQSMAALIMPERYRSRHKDGMALFLKTGKGPVLNKLIELPAIKQSGEEFPIELIIKLIKQGDEEFFCAFIRDATEKKLAEKKLTQSGARLIEAQEVAKVGSWETDLVTLKVIWSDETYRIFELDASEFVTSHPRFLEFVHPDDVEKVNTAFANSITGNAINKVVHRVLTAGGAIKIVEVRWRIFRDGEGKPARAVGTCQDITERKKSKTALQKAYEEKNTVLERIDDGFFALDENSIVTYWNKRAEMLLGIKKEELIGKNLHQVFLLRGSSIFYHNYLKAISEKITIHFEGYSHMSKKWFTVSAYGSENGLSVYFKDVTEQKDAEEKLKESEARYRSFFESSMDGILITVTDGEILSVNPAACEIFKMTEDQICTAGRFGIADLTDPRLLTLIEERKRTGSVKGEVTLLRKNGSKFEAELTATVFTDSCGQNRTSIIVRDITERKKAETKLKRSNERYNLICKATNDMVWDWDLVTGKVYRNKEGWKKIFRTGDNEIENGLIEDWDFKIHPDDQDTVKNVQDEIQKSEKDFFEVECRMLRDDGTYAYVHDRGHVIRNVQGKAIRLIGATQDITARKHAELQVAKSEFRFRSLVQNSSELICIFNDRGYFIYSSPAIKKMLGFEPEEITEKNVFAFLHPDDITPLKDYLSQMKSDMNGEMPLLRFKNTKGEWRWIESRVTNMSDNPEVAGYVFNCRDVTEKVVLEKILETERLLKHQQITQAVISAQEQERQELGGELHDNVNQILAGALLYLGLAKRELNIDHRYLQETDTLINTAIEEIRNLSHSLIPPSLHESEFLETLKNLLEVTQKTSGIVISLQACGFDESSIPDKLKLTIYRIVQEQINNILKHAAAQKVIVQLVNDNEKTLLCIKDDGIGFDTSKKANGVGLMNIKTRASLFNGDVSIISSPGNGCEVRVLFN